ncbi:MAG: TonB-dependent receptor [Acidobacteriaceae bacterium]|nr:TonB-dependent receptor [Acidobacteriaceae bacterium]MBV9781824.1 TonB-dependent receptor [Acidobacteriaceae bacterium]
MITGKRLLQFAALFGFALSAPIISAQSGYKAQIRGTVADQQGGVVPGATVTLTDTSTNISSTQATNAQGLYTFNELRPGKYNLLIESKGFRPFESKDIVLQVSQEAVINVTLKIGSVSASVDVNESAPLLDTGNAEIGTTITGSTTRDIPLYGRSFFSLVFLAGGVTESPGSGMVDSYPSGTNFISNGQRNATAEVRLDGALTSAPEQGEGGNSNVYYEPSVEVIEEFKVQTNSFSAEFGNNGGSVLNILMKQGGNAFHGSGWWFGQRSALDSNDFFSNAAGIPKPNHRHDQYGFMVNGPIKRNKTFFLFDFEKLHDASPVQVSTTVPTLAERQGDFSQTYYTDPNGNPVPNLIFDPTSGLPGSRSQFPGNVIPKSALDPIGMKVVGLYPLPNLPGDPLLATNNFRTDVLSTITGYQLDAKVDQQLTANQHLSVRYSRLHNFSATPTVFGDSQFNDGTNYLTNLHNAVIDYTWTVRPNLLVDLRAGLDRVAAPGYTNYPSFSSVGFPSVLEANGLTRMPMINMDDGPYSGLFTQCCVDTAFAHTLFTYSGSVSWVHGAHSMKFGGEQRLFYNNFGQPDSATGTFDFSQITTANDPLAGDITQGNPIAGLLLGYGDNNSLITIRPRVADKSKETAFYVQDDWKISPKLTVNLGLRYEWSTPYTERYNRIQFSDFIGNSGITLPGLPLQSGPLLGTTIFATPGRRNIPVDRNNFAPRLGFAYAPDSKTVIRGGAGIYYGMNIATNFQYAGPAFSKSEPIRFSLDGYQTQYATLENPFPTGLQPPQGRKYGALANWGFADTSDLDYETDRNAEIYQWSFGVQRLLPGAIVVGADYSANRSTHLPWGSWGFTRNRNFISTDIRSQYTSDELASLVPNPFLPLFAGPNAIFHEPDSIYNNPSIPLLNVLRPYPQFDGEFDGLPLLAANSRYNSLQLHFQKQAGKYFTFQGSYTLSHYTDDASSGANSWIGYYSYGAPQALDRLSREYGISGNDAPHIFTAVASVNLPFGRGMLFGSNMPRLFDAIAGGWSLYTSIAIQSGQPIPIGMSLPRLADGTQRPDVTCANPGTGISYHNAAATGSPMFNINCFADPGDQQLGNAPRYFDSLRLDGVRNVDAALRKEFTIRESVHLQLRFEGFNVFNRTRFGLPNNAYGDPLFGTVNSLAYGFSPRHIQLVARAEF